MKMDTRYYFSVIELSIENFLHLEFVRNGLRYPDGSSFKKQWNRKEIVGVSLMSQLQV